MAKITYQTENYTIEIDRDACIGCGTCEALAPKTFKLDKDLKSIVKEGSTDSKENLKNAIQSCAVEAIIIIDKKTGKKL